MVQTERETKLKRLLEISTALSSGSINDVETIRSEVATKDLSCTLNNKTGSHKIDRQ